MRQFDLIELQLEGLDGLQLLILLDLVVKQDLLIACLQDTVIHLPTAIQQWLFLLIGHRAQHRFFTTQLEHFSGVLQVLQFLLGRHGLQFQPVQLCLQGTRILQLSHLRLGVAQFGMQTGLAQGHQLPVILEYILSHPLLEGTEQRLILQYDLVLYDHDITVLGRGYIRLEAIQIRVFLEPLRCSGRYDRIDQLALQ